MTKRIKSLAGMAAAIVVMSLAPGGSARATTGDAGPLSVAATLPAADAAGPLPTATKSEDIQALFKMGYDRYSRKDYQAAADHLLTFLFATTPDVLDHEWAEFFFGMSLYKLGYTHAAVDSLTHLVTRKPNPQIVNYVLELLERITRTSPYDKQLVVDRAICDQSYGFVESRLAEFIHYYQGEYDWEHGFFAWGDEHFAKIPMIPITTTNICSRRHCWKSTTTAAMRPFPCSRPLS